MEFQQDVNSSNFYKESINLSFKWMRWADPLKADTKWNAVMNLFNTLYHFWKS